MTLCDPVINRLCGFEDNRLALEPTTLSSLVAICLAKLKYNVFCQLCDHLIICSKHQKTWFMVAHTIYLYLSKFSSHRPRGSEDISFLIWQVTSYGHADLLNLLKKTLMENFIFCAVSRDNELLTPSGFYFTDTDDSRDNRGRGRTIFYFTLPLPAAREYSENYLQLCMWDDDHIFLLAPLVFTRLQLDEIYHHIGLPFDNVRFWLFTWWFDSSFLLQQFEMGNRWTGTRSNYHHCIISQRTNKVTDSFVTWVLSKYLSCQIFIFLFFFL